MTQTHNGGNEHNFSDEKLQEIYLFALDLGRRAGRILQDGIDARTRGDQDEQEMVEKVNAVDIVTQTDLGELHTIISTSLVMCESPAQ